MKISVFGAGSWGIAIAILLHGNGHNVTLWVKNAEFAAALRDTRENPRLPGAVIPDGVHITSDTDIAAKGAEIAVFARPSQSTRETAEMFAGKLPRSCVALCAAKGIEQDPPKLLSDVLLEVFGESQPVAVLSGPAHAEEVARGGPTACVVASHDKAAAELVQDAFMSENFRVYTSDDIVGVQLGGSLKNIIALCAGICDGLGCGDNTVAALATRGLTEIAQLATALGGRRETVAGLAGLGDLIVTCTSRHSRNRRAGVLIGQGCSVSDAINETGAAVEGYYTARAVRKIAGDLGVEMPICMEAYSILFEDKNPHEVIHQLMTRTKRSESGTEFDEDKTWK
ncbi:MAG: NAD(P)-dependent glycerol-3-phosphate dehydrogenase [Clostridiales bacterium]|nr:NAD(P)-dependent glycerol-3-phosphate dehydrogenase [Clostridiales bacterium]